MHGKVTAYISDMVATVPTCACWNMSFQKVCSHCPHTSVVVRRANIPYHKRIVVGCAFCERQVDFVLDKHLVIQYSRIMYAAGEISYDVHKYVSNRMQEVHRDFENGRLDYLG